MAGASALQKRTVVSRPDDSRYPALTDLAHLPSILPTHVGAIGDYSGRVGSAGSGTDNRAAIQAALNAACDRNDNSYYGYITVKNGTVKLPSGDYYISAPNDGSPSLVVPPRVTFDCSDATLFFDYPASATNAWCGIQVNKYAQLIVGRIYSSPGASAPDSALAYDAIRLWQTDNNTRVIGYKDSEIGGFQGAGIRGVGAWISYVKGIRFSGLQYGYIASNYGDGTLGGSLSNPSGGGTNRTHTDLFIEDCQFVNIVRVGFLGIVQGNAGNINILDFSASGLTVDFDHCVFESIAGFAIQVGNALVVSARALGLEEVGSTGSTQGMVYLQQVATASFRDVRINLAGRTIQGASGPTQPVPGLVFQNSSVQNFVAENFYVHNTLNNGLKFADNAAILGWRVGGIRLDADDFASGSAMYAGPGAFAFDGTWNKGHVVIGGHHLWTDSTGALRRSSAAPTSDTDGAVLSGRVIQTLSTATALGAQLGADYVALVTGTTTITLPTAVGNLGRYTVKNAGSNTVSVASTSAQTFDGSASPITLTPGDSLDLISDGANWRII